MNCYGVNNSADYFVNCSVVSYSSVKCCVENGYAANCSVVSYSSVKCCAENGYAVSYSAVNYLYCWNYRCGC